MPQRYFINPHHKEKFYILWNEYYAGELNSDKKSNTVRCQQSQLATRGLPIKPPQDIEINKRIHENFLKYRV